MMKTVVLISAAVLGLAACGPTQPAETARAPAAAPAEPAAAPAAPSPQQIIEARQANLKDMGANFKAINDATKASTPDMVAVQAAAAKIKAYSADIGTWFPAGTGAETGIKTAALPKLWEDQATFQAAVTKLQEETGKMQVAAASGDIAQVKAQFGATGGACKNCHDNFRKKEDQ